MSAGTEEREASARRDVPEAAAPAGGAFARLRDRWRRWRDWRRKRARLRRRDAFLYK